MNQSATSTESSVLTVAGVGKAYRHYASKWARAREWLGGRTRHEKTWVLSDISFSVAPGEAMGIIGVNGAGKSTLLKIITGTTQPSTGSVSTKGRVAALLELGMGFHPDFTGRQNAYMAGQLMGLSTQEITELMPEIEEFAEIGSYIDQPIRVYSSGMQMRLAFSVATAKRPDMLIVDEALSVGDAHFQHKSFDRIREFRKKGTTLLIVSHDKSAIQSICDRAILLSGGKIAFEGKPEFVMDQYNVLIASHQNQHVKMTPQNDGAQRVESGTLEAEIIEIDILNEVGSSIETIAVGEAISVRIKVRINDDVNGLVLGIGIKDRYGQMIFGTNTHNTQQRILDLGKGELLYFEVSFIARLGIGSFSIHCSLIENESHAEKSFHWIDRAKVFEVINTNKPDFTGCAWNELDVVIHRNVK